MIYEVKILDSENNRVLEERQNEIEEKLKSGVDVFRVVHEVFKEGQTEITFIHGHFVENRKYFIGMINHKCVIRGQTFKIRITGKV